MRAVIASGIVFSIISIATISNQLLPSNHTNTNSQGSVIGTDPSPGTQWDHPEIFSYLGTEFYVVSICGSCHLDPYAHLQFLISEVRKPILVVVTSRDYVKEESVKFDFPLRFVAEKDSKILNAQSYPRLYQFDENYRLKRISKR